MTSAPTLEPVRAIVARVAGPDRSSRGPGPHTPLREGGFWLDSVNLLEAIFACKAEFALTLEPEADFTDQTLSTVGTLSSLIEARRAR